MVVNRPLMVETHPDFTDVVKKRAEDSADAIDELDIVNGIDVMKARLDETAFARRLMRAVDSSGIMHMDKNEVKEFVDNHPILKNKIKYEGDKIDVSKKSVQNAFVRLMNDDYLHSNLSNKDYVASSKKPLR